MIDIVAYDDPSKLASDRRQERQQRRFRHGRSG